MKAVLVIDIPNENLWRTSNDIYERMKGYKCSLKPLPDRQKVKAGAGGYTRGFTAGFNKFRYLIAGEEIEG